jgi:hypothetical protein
MTWQKKLNITFGVVAVVGSVTWLAEPSLVRWQVEKRLPQGVEVGRIEIGFDGVTLHNVTVEREWVSGTLPEVFVARDESIEVRGGSLIVDLDKQPKGSGTGEKRSITAKGLMVDVTKGKLIAILTGASWDGSKACFTNGNIGYAKAEAHVTSGCYTRADGSFIADKVMAHLTDLPKIPGLPLTETDVLIEGFSMDKIPLQEGVHGFEASKFEAGPVSGTGAHASWSWEKGSLLFDAEVFTLKHPWLDSEPTSFKNIHIVMVKNHLVTVRVNESATLEADLETQTVKGMATCQRWVDALPENLRVGPLGTDLKFTGDLNFSVSMKPTPILTLNAKCRVVCANFPKLREPFTYVAYKADGTTFERKTGPGTADWVSLAATGPMPMAVINMEDPGFPGHRGYLTGAFQNSLVENVQKGKFVRGGSTITQQTAKNLWLKREKTIGRKVEELFLAQALESCLTKDQIIETYLNIVEFGPNVYGIGPGARLWFDKTPDTLTPTQAFWLASILPAPKKASRPTVADLKRIDKLMSSLADQGRIPDLGGGDGSTDATGWDVNQ